MADVDAAGIWDQQPTFDRVWMDGVRFGAFGGAAFGLPWVYAGPQALIIGAAFGALFGLLFAVGAWYLGKAITRLVHPISKVKALGYGLVATAVVMTALIAPFNIFFAVVPSLLAVVLGLFRARHYDSQIGAPEGSAG